MVYYYYMNNSKNRFQYIATGVVIIAITVFVGKQSTIFNSKLVPIAHAASINDSGYQSFDGDSADQSSSSETQPPAPSATDDQSSSGDTSTDTTSSDTPTNTDSVDQSAATTTETDGYVFGTDPGIVETTNQSLADPVSNIIVFHTENAPSRGSTKTTSKSTKTSSKTKSVPQSQPYVPSSSTVVASIDYTLDGKPLHSTTTFPDTWEFDTRTVPNGGFTLTANYHYADGSTRSSTTLVFPHNDKTIFQKVADVFKGVWEGMKQVFGSTKK